jgi:hypothetical protein
MFTTAFSSGESNLSPAKFSGESVDDFCRIFQPHGAAENQISLYHNTARSHDSPLHNIGVVSFGNKESNLAIGSQLKKILGNSLDL